MNGRKILRCVGVLAVATLAVIIPGSPTARAIDSTITLADVWTQANNAATSAASAKDQAAQTLQWVAWMDPKVARAQASAATAAGNAESAASYASAAATAAAAANSNASTAAAKAGEALTWGGWNAQGIGSVDNRVRQVSGLVSDTMQWVKWANEAAAGGAASAADAVTRAADLQNSASAALSQQRTDSATLAELKAMMGQLSSDVAAMRSAQASQIQALSDKIDALSLSGEPGSSEASLALLESLQQAVASFAACPESVRTPPWAALSEQRTDASCAVDRDTVARVAQGIAERIDAVAHEVAVAAETVRKAVADGLSDLGTKVQQASADAAARVHDLAAQQAQDAQALRDLIGQGVSAGGGQSSTPRLDAARASVQQCSSLGTVWSASECAAGPTITLPMAGDIHIFSCTMWENLSWIKTLAGAGLIIGAGFFCFRSVMAGLNYHPAS